MTRWTTAFAIGSELSYGNHLKTVEQELMQRSAALLLPAMGFLLRN
ncbi:hypothetical protein [Rheinheimera sp.]|jgi:hypothetical protein|nr:hypothetical protein [Rheinheimera sp.]MCA1928296.1 hypothetical protein [Rheinheimera sp.]